MVSVPDKQRSIREPPVLLHACKSFAIFCIKPPASSKRPGVSEVVQLTMLHSCNDPPSPVFTSTGADDPMLPFRSPAATAVAGTSPTCPISPLTNSAAVVIGCTNSLRLRSQSDCVVNSPVKGILKRRSFGRSYSESHDQATSMASAAELTGATLLSSCCTSEASMPHFDCCAFAGDDCECAMSVTTANGAKKSVTFSERVEENVFRPGSSILGQRKKNQRKAVARLRKRKESIGSSCSSLCDIHECASAEDVDDENAATAATSASEGQSDSSFVDDSRNDDDDDDEPESTAITFGANYLEDKEYSPPLCLDAVSIQDNNAVDERRSEMNLKIKTSKKKKSADKSTVVAKPPAVALQSDKYRGFLLAPVAATRAAPAAALDAAAVAHALGRLSSVDSALGAELMDDEAAAAADGLKRLSADASSTPDSRKDSGVDDDLQLEELCIRMCEAVVSG